MKHLIFLLVFLAGCSTCETFVSRMEASWKVIGPKHKQYIDADESLTPEQKEMRKKAVDTVDGLIQDEKANLGME